ncbi:MAG TPA: ElyC/SanA/YdcF family protein [Spirochaetota bacterium]|jgi:SanA protein|nr:MAG: vancomycin high temperature exclusion protein [Spirochaetes bacterium ADurb.BinA120]HNU91596.1 ElyC/SanA/YdcF family protein [Spirochaetota bacterium]HPI15213.1 ElyC/SanA/YdcF family protein [Spirochaetota bacterium]HPO44851.1 ElyC/SanA/YdcF family protein [Spirochaetota bacterium]HPV98126.1 ElyC/SanA/YdcF family protein [Spirochaetota bacterium]
MKTLRYILIIAIFLSLLAGGAVWHINSCMERKATPLIRRTAEECAPAQAAILLGAGVYSGRRVSPVVYDRILAAVELYRSGRVGKILISGDHGTPYYDEVNTIHHWLRKKAVPERDIFTDYAGFSTYDSIVRAKEVFEVQTAILVTQEYHLPRALHIASSLGIDAQGLVADRRGYRHIVRYTAREIPARVKDYFYANMLKPAPRHHGRPVPITGDGRASRNHASGE